MYYIENIEYRNRPSRYSILRVINSNYKYLETQNQKDIPVSSTDSYHIVTQGERNRLDIISNQYYQTPIYWWAIALANNLIDPFIIEEGTMLRIPALNTLYNPNNNILERLDD